MGFQSAYTLRTASGTKQASNRCQPLSVFEKEPPTAYAQGLGPLRPPSGVSAVSLKPVSAAQLWVSLLLP